MRAGDVYKVKMPTTIRAYTPFASGCSPNRTHILTGTPVILVKRFDNVSGFDFSNLWRVRALNAYADYLTPATPLEALAFSGEDYE